MKRVAEAEAERRAAERAKVHAAKWRAIAERHEAMGDTAGAERFRAVADAEERGGKETDGAEASRKAGFIGNALARAAGVRVVDVAATLAGWSAERVRAVALAAVADMGEDAPEYALEAATALWWEARARVAVRGYMRSVGAEMFGANYHDGGARRACATSPDEYARKVQAVCTGLLLEETENIFLSMTATAKETGAKVDSLREDSQIAEGKMQSGFARVELQLTAGKEMDPERVRWMRDLCEGRPGWAETLAVVIANPGATQEKICALVTERTGQKVQQSTMSERLAKMESAWTEAHPAAGPLFPNRRSRGKGMGRPTKVPELRDGDGAEDDEGDGESLWDNALSLLDGQ